MLPKRKFIKKRINRAQQNGEEIQQPRSLIQKLRSGEISIQEEGLVYISSMCILPDEANTFILLSELISLLHKGPSSIIYQTLYALCNLIQIQPKISQKLFQMNLDKALMVLNSNDKDLLKPILQFMIALHGNIPPQYLYLEKGVQQSLNNTHFTPSNLQSVLQFLFRTECPDLRLEVYQAIGQIMQKSQKLKLRALSAAIILRNKVIAGYSFEKIKDLCEQLLIDIDLEKEYQTNICQHKPIPKQKQVQTDMIQQQEPVHPINHVNHDMFKDAVDAVQTIMEAILIQFQSGQITNEKEEDGDQQWVEENNESQMAVQIISFLSKHAQKLSKNIMITFMEGQNIINLTLRILSYIFKSDKSPLVDKVTDCIENVFKVNPPRQLLLEIVNVGLYLLINVPLAGKSREMILYLAQNVLLIKDCDKDCWLCLLQLIGFNFNPQKCPVSVQENRRVGSILRQLLINIPYITLEEWRGQTIDTIFDVFSNEQFDHHLVQLGILPILNQVLEQSKNGKKKKFVREVLQDIHRFLEYKKKMIKF